MCIDNKCETLISLVFSVPLSLQEISAIITKTYMRYFQKCFMIFLI